MEPIIVGGKRAHSKAIEALLQNKQAHEERIVVVETDAMSDFKKRFEIKAPPDLPELYVMNPNASTKNFARRERRANERKEKKLMKRWAKRYN